MSRPRPRGVRVLMRAGRWFLPIGQPVPDLAPPPEPENAGARAARPRAIASSSVNRKPKRRRGEFVR